MTRPTTPPDPLVPPEVDLRGLDYMPFFGHHLLGSEFHARCTDAEWRAGVTLWWAAWNQVPAASLPDDDVALCRLADLGRDVKEWKRLRGNALHGFVLCSDGRLYHKFIAEQALIAWEKRVNERKRKQRWRQGRPHAGDGDETGTETGTSPSPEPGPGRGQDSPPDGDVPSDGTGRDGTGRKTKPQGALSQVSSSGPPPAPLRALSGDSTATATATAVRHGELAKLLRGLGVQATPSHPYLIAWVDELAITDTEVQSAVTQARFSKPKGAIPIAYLEPIVRELRTKPKAAGVARWWESEEATNAMAAELGLRANNGEAWPDFRSRIRKRLEQLGVGAAA